MDVKSGQAADINPIFKSKNQSTSFGFLKHKRVSILGSTGSVGCNTVDLIKQNPEHFSVQALTANTNIELLASQAKTLRAKFVAIADRKKFKDLKGALSGTSIEVAAGVEGICEAAARDADFVMAGIVGIAGLKPTLSAIQSGKTVGFANKECLVSAGDVMLSEIKRNNATLLPVDSEHNAIFQVFDFKRLDQIERIILTASGGPFRNFTKEKMIDVTPKEAVAHPNWDMGDKISIDSATMMNKGLELIEAHFLFGLPEDKIDILVHPQSVIHSMVAYIDGSVLAQLGTPDMRTPIAYTLAWPERMEVNLPKLSLQQLATLSFESPDVERFPPLRLAREALRSGGATPAFLNAANEISVEYFLRKKIKFLDIASTVEEVIGKAPKEKLKNLEQVFAADNEARNLTKDIIKKVIKKY